MIRRAAIWLFCTLVCTWQYVTITLATCDDCNQRMADIVQGHSIAPFAYRLLTPAILVVMGNTPQAFALYHMLMIGMFFFLLAVWAATWQVNPVTAMLLIALCLVVMYPTWYFSAWSVFEWNCLLIGLWLLPRFWLSPQ